jgi:IS30 family transposase
VSIEERAKKINERKEFGHWEADSVVSCRSGKGGLHTEIERVSRYKFAAYITDLSSKTTIKVQKAFFASLPKVARKSVTFDNGVENHLHYELNELGMKTYFCHPYSSWEKGSNENANGLYRRLFPKGTDFSKVDPVEIQLMTDYYNNRPMKVLGYRTPAEVFAEQLAVAA